MEILSGIAYRLSYRPLIFLLVLFCAAIYLAFRIKKLNKPFDETDHDIDEDLPEEEEPVPETAQSNKPLQEAVMPPPSFQSKPQLQVEAASPGKFDIPSRKSSPQAQDDTISSRMSTIEDALKQLSGKVDALTQNIAKNPQAGIPKNTMRVIESLPGAIDSLRKNMSVPKPSGPPVESPLLKEIAASIVALQKQFAAVSPNAARQSAGSTGAGISPDKFTAFMQKIENLGGQVKSIETNIKSLAAAKAVAGGGAGISEETINLFKNLLANIESLKTQMSSQKASGAGIQDLKPFLDRFVKQMENFQVVVQDIKKSVSGKPGSGSSLKDLSSLQQATLDLKAAFSAATEAEEDMLSRITTKLDIIHQVITSQTIGSGSSGSITTRSSGTSRGGPEIIDTGSGSGKDIF